MPGGRRRNNDIEKRKKSNRPPAPPAPPKSLVELLQKDKKVLKYFQSLQENLAYDVQVWKDRAKEYQSQLRLAQHQQQELDNSSDGDKKPKGKSQRKENNKHEKKRGKNDSDDNNQEGDKEQQQLKIGNKPQENNIPDDSKSLGSIFSSSSSSSSSPEAKKLHHNDNVPMGNKNSKIEKEKSLSQSPPNTIFVNTQHKDSASPQPQPPPAAVLTAATATTKTAAENNHGKKSNKQDEFELEFAFESGSESESETSSKDPDKKIAYIESQEMRATAEASESAAAAAVAAKTTDMIENGKNKQNNDEFSLQFSSSDSDNNSINSDINVKTANNQAANKKQNELHHEQQNNDNHLVNNDIPPKNDSSTTKSISKDFQLDFSSDDASSSSSTNNKHNPHFGDVAITPDGSNPPTTKQKDSTINTKLQVHSTDDNYNANEQQLADKSIMDSVSTSSDEANEFSFLPPSKKRRRLEQPQPSPRVKALPVDDQSGTSQSTENHETFIVPWTEHQLKIIQNLERAQSYLKFIGLSFVVAEQPKTQQPEQHLDESQINKDHYNIDSRDELLPTATATKRTKGSNATAMTITTNETNQSTQSIMSTPSDYQTTVKYHRKDDLQVLSDLSSMLKLVTRIKTTNKENSIDYCPFMSTDLLLPCYVHLRSINNDRDQHPAVKFTKYLISTLAIVDAYSGMSEIEWDLLWGKERKYFQKPIHRQIYVGMQNRQILIGKIITSLVGEISQTWGVQDRSVRIQTTALHYQPDETDDTNKKQSLEEKIHTQSDGAAEQSVEDQKGSTILLNKSNDADYCVHDSSSRNKSFHSKSHSRLAGMVERSTWVLLVTNLSILRNNSEPIKKMLWNYVTSTTPSLAVEDYPKLPPVMSLLMLETMINPVLPFMSSCNHREQTTSPIQQWLSHMVGSTEGRQLIQILSLTIHITATIFETRLQSTDDRICDVCRVELASYKRICIQNKSWLFGNVAVEGLSPIMKLNELRNKVKEFIRECIDTKQMDKYHLKDDTAADAQTMLPLNQSAALQLALTIEGSMLQLEAIIEDKILLLNDHLAACRTKNNGDDSLLLLLPHFQFIFLACCAARRCIEIRRIDEYRENIGSSTSISALVANPLKTSYTSRLWKLLMGHPIDKKILTIVLQLAQMLLLACQQLGDGETTIHIFQWLVQHEHEIRDIIASDSNLNFHHLMDIIQRTAHAPTIRVINLERRRDRLIAFYSLALQENILVLHGVETICHKDKSESNNELKGKEDGCSGYALDGHGKVVEAEERLSQLVGGSEILHSLVQKRWCPNDLQAFDKTAPSTETLVRISPTEKACALSHILTWKGVVSAFVGNDDSGGLSDIPQECIFRNPDITLRTLKVSGIASGTALIFKNESMHPSPVCVILEDDAILVDRFTHRLNALLAELPRDFHFCSIGYGRPKSAPLLKYSSQLGIPTCIWYLTGYLLSLDGAKYLLDSLPVRGPIDSWIGLQMFSNWDNIYGQQLCVGTNKRRAGEYSVLPPRKVLGEILRFRAFAALVPLCSQKVRTGSSTPASGGTNWRQRDTDVEYSGNLVK